MGCRKHRFLLSFSWAFFTACSIGNTAHAQDGSQNLINVSWGDQILNSQGDAQLDTAGKIVRSMKNWKEGNQGDTILWRTSAYYIRDYYLRNPAVAGTYWNKVDQIFSQFDPMAVASAAAKQNGQTFLNYMTIYDHGAPASIPYDGPGTNGWPWQDHATIANPEYQVQARNGDYQYGVLEMANPAARQLMVDRMTYYTDTWDTDGIYVDTRTHSMPAEHADKYGFGPEVAQEYLNRYGIDILSDSRFDYTAPTYNPLNPAVENWRKLRGEYLVEFFRDLRQALPNKTIYASIPRGRYLGYPYGNMYLDWESLVTENLVDGLVVGVDSGIQHPNLHVDPSTIGYLSSEVGNINIPSRENAIANVYGPLADQNGVKLYFNTFDYTSQEQQWVSSEPLLNGVMINTPSGVGGRSSILHNNALDFPDGKMTVEAFLNPREINSVWQRVLSKYDHTTEGGAGRGWEWILLPSGQLRFRIELVNAGRTLDTNTVLTEGAWVHIATTFDATSGEMRIYVDGQLDASLNVPPAILNSTPNQDLYIGRYGGADAFTFDGMIDELRLTADALTFNGVPAQPYTGTEPNTIAYYNFDQLQADSEFVNLASGPVENVNLLAGGEQAIVEALPGFGQALELGFQILPEPIPGDFDNDWDVDGNDLFRWEIGFRTNALGDADGDGDTDGADFLAWQLNFLPLPGPPPMSDLSPVINVPEPSTLFLAIIATLVSKALRQYYTHS